MKLRHQFPERFFEESKATFVVDRDRKRLWAALLDLLAEFDRVCRAHGIKYSIDGGTILGKVRHDGIIPWDDDIDVIITRPEYDKLLKVADDEFRKPYFLQTMESDPEALRGHPQFRNGNMTAILKGEMKDGKAIYKTFNQGLFMDIFVLDAIPDDLAERKAYFSELTYLKGMMGLARRWKYAEISLGFAPRQILDFCRALKDKFRLFRVRTKTKTDPLVYFQTEFDKACRRYENVQTHDVSHILFMTNPPLNRIVERTKILDTEDVDFMGLKVPMVKEWDYYLTLLYGDWHKYVIGGAKHGGVFFDLDRPYTYYFTHPCK